MAFTDSADVFSVEASAADGRATAAATGFGWTVFFVSSWAGAAAASVDAMTADDATAIGDFGNAISAGSGMAVGGALMLATSVCQDGWRAAISTAAAMTQIAPAKTARGVSTGTALMSGVGAGLFARIVGRIDRVAFRAFLAFFAGTDILLSESFWSFRSAESTYRIDRAGLDRLSTRTDVLLGETRWNS